MQNNDFAEDPVLEGFLHLLAVDKSKVPCILQLTSAP